MSETEYKRHTCNAGKPYQESYWETVGNHENNNSGNGMVFKGYKPMVSDNLPNKMCSYCAVWITKLIHFKLQCQVSERLLTSLLKYYKEEVEKASAIVTVGGQQWNIPVQDTSELLSRYETHLNKLHKAVQYTVTHLDKRAVEGHPVLPYRTVNTVQFYLTFIQHLLLSVNSVIGGDNQGALRTHMPVTSKEQPLDRNFLPLWAQEILNHSYGQLWDRFIQATCDSFGSRQNNCGGSSSNQQQISKPTCISSVEHADSSEFPVLQSVLSNSRKEQHCQYPQKSTARNETSQMVASSSQPLVVDLDEETSLENSNVSKSDQLKQAALTSQPQKSVSVQKVIQGLSNQGRESIHILQKSAETTEHLNNTSEIQPSNILAQQRSQQQQLPPTELSEFQTATHQLGNSSKPSEDSMPQRQLTSPAQNTKVSQEAKSKNSKSQADIQHSKSTEISLQLESLLNNDLETTQSAQIFSEVHELLTSTSVQDSLADRTLQSVQSSTLQDLVGNTQELQKSVSQLIGSECLKSQTVGHSSLLDTSSSAEKKTPESEAGKAMQGSQHPVSTESRQMTRRIENISEQLQAESQKTVKEKESQELTNKHSELPKEGKEQQESQGVIKKISEYRETAKERLGSQEVNKTQQQTNKTGLKELTSQATNELKQPNMIQESQEQINRTNEPQTIEMQQRVSNQSLKQLSETQTSANQATCADKSVQQQIPEAVSSSGQEAADVQAHQESSTKSAKQLGLQTNDKQQFFELILHKVISRAYERKKAAPTILKRRERARSFEEPASLELEKLIEVRIKNEPSESTDNKLSRPSSAPNAGVFDDLPPLVPIPKSSSPNTASNLPCITKVKERSINSGNGKDIPSSISKPMDNRSKDKNVSGNTVPSSLQSSQQHNMADKSTSKALNAQQNSDFMENSTDSSALKSSSPATLQSMRRNEESRKSSEETNIPKDPVVITKGLIRVRQDLATDPATRISSHNSKQVEPSNSFTVLPSQQQNQVNTSNLAQPFPMMSDVQESGTVVSQQHTSQLRVPVSGNTSFTATAPRQTALPFIQHNHIPSVISGSVSNQKQIFPVMNTTSQQQWMIRQAPPYQFGHVGTMPQNYTSSSSSTTNVSQALPAGVITTVFQNPKSTPPYPQSLPTIQAAQSGVNSLVTNVPLQPSLTRGSPSEEDTAAMSRLYQKHLGIVVPQSEHFKEPWISQLVSKLQLVQNGAHYLLGRTQVCGVPQQKTAAGMAEQQQHTAGTSTSMTSGSHIGQIRASVPVSQQNMQYVTVPVSQPQNSIPGQQTLPGTGVPLFPLSSMNRMVMLQQQQQARSRVISIPTSSQQPNPLRHIVQQHPQALGTPTTVSQQPIPAKGNVLHSQQRSVITSVLENTVQPQNTVQVTQAEANNSNNNNNNNNNHHPSISQQALKTGNNLSVLQHQKVQAGAGTSAPQQSWSRILVPQHQNGQAGASTYTSHFVMCPRMSVPTSQSQKMQAGSSTSVSQNIAQINASISVPEQQKQTKPATTISQNVKQSTYTVSSWQQQKQVLGALLTRQIVQPSRGPPVVCIQKAQPVSQQEIQTRNNTTGIQAANGTMALQPHITHIANSAQHTKHAYTTAVSRGMILSNQCNAVTSNKTSPPQGQLLAVRECIGALVQQEVNRVYEPGIVTPNQITINVPSANNQSSKQHYLNIPPLCYIESKQRNLSAATNLQAGASSASEKSAGHHDANIQRQSETGQNSATHNSFSKKDQPGISVLPDVVRAIGPELGVYMEEDALESSVYRINSWKSVMVPEQLFMQGKQKSKSSAARSARALAQSMKLNLISLMRQNSREQLGLSEQKWQKLQAAILDPSVFRSSNWKLIKPPGVKIRRYINRRKSEQNNTAVISVTEQQLRENAPPGGVLQSEVVSSFPEFVENSGQVDNSEKLCDFRIKITKNNGKYESSPVDHSSIKDTCMVSEFDSDSSDSWELYVPRAAKRRRIIYDDDDDANSSNHDDDENREDDKPSIKVSQLHAYQLAPFVSMTKLHPEFFKPGNLYDLKDSNIAAMAQRLSMVVRKPGTIGRTVKQELQQ